MPFNGDVRHSSTNYQNLAETNKRD